MLSIAIPNENVATITEIKKEWDRLQREKITKHQTSCISDHYTAYFDFCIFVVTIHKKSRLIDHNQETLKLI